MIEADDIDEDYFIPTNKSTLANIFSSTSSKSSENSSLQYVSPKPSVPKPEDSKASECIFACSLQAFEWYNNIYTPRGNVGFAIVKIVKSGFNNILLYDANKSSLSCATVQPSLNMKLKGGTYLSYYDNTDKYWSLYGSAIDIKSIVECLRNLNCVVTLSPLEDENACGPVQNAEEKIESPTDDHCTLKESDTDSSLRNKTRQSILSRMANMGQSVLPPQTIMTGKTSDSSDTNDSNEYHKVTRHKSSKPMYKKSIEKEPQCLGASNFELESISHSSLSERQLLPIIKTDIISNVSVPQDLNMLMSEQRQSNSELRINMGRLTDKMDKLLDKVNTIKHSEKSAEYYQIEIYRKLLSEYEKKIHVYESLIKSKGFLSNIGAENVENELKTLKENKSKLENSNKDKDSECACSPNEHEIVIAQLSEKTYFMENETEQQKENIAIHLERQNIDSSTAELTRCNFACQQEKFNLIKKIQELSHELSGKEVELLNYKSATDKLLQKSGSAAISNTSIGVKVKRVMNDTFQSIAANFNDGETYLGSAVKNTAATIIKEVTLETLKTICSDS